MNEKEFAELAAGHALGALSPDDAAAFELARRQHPEWEHHLETDAATAALLGDAVAEVAPPPGIRDALLARVETLDAAEAAPVEDSPAPEDSPPSAPAAPRSSVRRWWALAAAILLVLGIGGGVVLVSQQLAPPASVVALEQIEAAPDAQSASGELADGGEVTAHWSESVGKAVLVSEGLPVIADDQDFELWFVRDGTPIAAGVFAAEGGEATALLQGTMEPGDVIAITIEQAGGSPDGQPTTEPIVAIATA